MYSNEAENTISERLTLQSQTISFRTKSIKPPSMEHLVWRHYPHLSSIRLPETFMMPVESVEGVSVFLVLMILFSLGEPMKKKQSIFCICWERCVLSTFFPNCLDKLITQHIIYFFFLFLSERVGCGGLKQPH